MNIQDVKNRFGIIGSSALLDRAIEVAMQVAPTDLTVLITGESGSGKEVFPQIIHQQSVRKFGQYIAVNCGAIPEGTIDSELFGHEKGSFTGAHEARKGYFEVVNQGTIFLDEVAELPMPTQARLLRVLETGEFLKVGSSKVLKTDVRVIAATNVNLQDAIHKGKFREDLFYRLNTVPIQVPPLRKRREDIHLIFRKFASDFAGKYRMPAIKLDPDAIALLEQYHWPGNVRQLKNITEQISVIEKVRDIHADTLNKYLPDLDQSSNLPIRVKANGPENEFSERELLYKVLFDLKKDLNDLKKLVVEMASHTDILKTGSGFDPNSVQYLSKIFQETHHENGDTEIQLPGAMTIRTTPASDTITIEHKPEVEESLSLEEREKELIIKALEKNKGRRKNAARELGISERTLYRKINEYHIDK
jgi:transcriptional regulator with PAS, ATPase and Fis domain